MFLMAGALVSTCTSVRRQFFRAAAEAKETSLARAALLDLCNVLKSEGSSKAICLRAELIGAKERLLEQSGQVSASEIVQREKENERAAEDELVSELRQEVLSTKAAEASASEEAQILRSYGSLLGGVFGGSSPDGDAEQEKSLAQDIAKLRLGLNCSRDVGDVSSLKPVHDRALATYMQLCAKLDVEKSEESKGPQTLDAVERERLELFTENARLRSELVTGQASRANIAHAAAVFNLGADVQDAHNVLLDKYGSRAHAVVGFEVVVGAHVNDLGMSFSNFPPGRVFVQEADVGGWAHSAGIRAGAAIILLHNEDTAHMIPGRFQALLHLRPLHMKVLPPPRQSAILAAEEQLGMLIQYVAKSKRDIESGRLVSVKFTLEGIDFSKLDMLGNKVQAQIATNISAEIAKAAGVGKDAVEVQLGGSLAQAVAFTPDPRVADLMHGKLLVATSPVGTKPAPLQTGICRAVRDTFGSSLATTGQLIVSNMEVGPVITAAGNTAQDQYTDERISNAMAAFHFQEYEKLLNELAVTQVEILNCLQAAKASGEPALGPLQEVTAGEMDKQLGFALDHSDFEEPVVKEVVADGWAARNGIKPNSVIMAVNGEDPARMSSTKFSLFMKVRPLRLLVRVPMALGQSGIAHSLVDGLPFTNKHEIDLLRAELDVARQEQHGSSEMQIEEAEGKIEYEEAFRLEATAQLEMDMVQNLKIREREACKDAVLIATLSGQALPAHLAWRADFGLLPDIRTSAKELKEERREIQKLRTRLVEYENLAIKDTEAWEARINRTKKRSHGHRDAYSVAEQVGSAEVATREALGNLIQDEEDMVASELQSAIVLRDESSRAQQSSWREGALVDFLQRTFDSLSSELVATRKMRLEESANDATRVDDVIPSGISDAAEDALRLRREAEYLHLEVCTWRNAHADSVALPPMEWRRDEVKLLQEQVLLSPRATPRSPAARSQQATTLVLGADTVDSYEKATPKADSLAFRQVQLPGWAEDTRTGLKKPPAANAIRDPLEKTDPKEAEASEPVDQTVAQGTVMVCVACEGQDYAEIYASTVSDEIVRHVQIGEKITVAGDPVEVQGYMMIPVEPNGAAQLDMFQVHAAALGAKQLDDGREAGDKRPALGQGGKKSYTKPSLQRLGTEEAVLRRVLGSDSQYNYTGPLGDTGRFLEPPPPHVDLSKVRETARWASSNIRPGAYGQITSEDLLLRQTPPRIKAPEPPLPPPALPPKHRSER